MKIKQKTFSGGEFFNYIPLNSTELDIVEFVRNEFTKARQPNSLHGMRVEAMFSYVAGALGKCKLIKQEDTVGICLVENTEIVIPDFRVILKDGNQLFVEVKNCHNNSLEIKFHKSYIENLKNYSNIHDIPIKIAVYWSKIQAWTLISVDELVFDNNKQKFILNFRKAIMINEMATLGDMRIGTKSPLIFKMLANQGNINEIDSNGKVLFTIDKVEIYSDCVLIEDDFEKNLAFNLMLYGTWSSGDGEALVEDGKLLGAEYCFEPENTAKSQGFEMIGCLSDIISRMYNDATAPERNINRLIPENEPEKFRILIPEYYEGKYLPLWRFIQQPNLTNID